MYSSELTRESIHSSDKANKERQPARLEVAQIQKTAENLASWPVRREINQWNQDAKETQDVEKEHAGFNPWEKAAKIGVDEQSECQCRVKQHCSVPSLVAVMWIIQDQ